MSSIEKYDKVKVILNSPGIIELLKSDEIREELHRCAESVAAEAGEGFEIEDRELQTRGAVRVYADAPEAWRAVHKENVLEKAVRSRTGGGESK